MAMFTIEEPQAPGPEIEEAILDVLIEYNERVAGPADYSPLALVVRDEAGAVAGGLWGEIYYDWCVIRLLVVPEAGRGQGMGTRLMQQAEAIVRGRGADGIWLDTFSFQARGFYEKQGYTCFAALPGHPREGSRFFMQKPLA